MPGVRAIEALVYGDAEAYVANGKYNKPGTMPLALGTDVDHGCPHDCGLCARTTSNTRVSASSK